MTNSINYSVLGCDPGKVNFAWAIYDDYGLQEHGVLDGAEEIKQLGRFYIHFANLISKYTPHLVGFERFTQRPGKGAVKNMELVNLMIGGGSVLCRLQGIHTKLVTAAEHKTWTPKKYKVEYLKRPTKSGGVSKKYNLATYQEWKDLPSEHEVDAANVAKYLHDHKMATFRQTLSRRQQCENQEQE